MASCTLLTTMTPNVNTTMTTPATVKLTQFETRLLLPFLFDATRIEALAAHLTAVQSLGGSIWRREVADANYTDNLFPYIRQFRESTSAMDHGCRLVLAPQAAKHLLKPIELPGTSVKAEINPRLPIEIFLSPYGAAVVSLSLVASDCQLPISELRAFHQRLHLGPEWRGVAPDRLVVVESELDDLLAGKQDVVSMISGLMGGAVPFGKAASAFGITEVQRSLSVYAVIRFPSSVDFGDHDTRSALYPELKLHCMSKSNSMRRSSGSNSLS